MPETKLWQMFECVGDKSEIHLSFRKDSTKDWSKIVGTKKDIEILKMEKWIVTAVKWERSNPGIIQIAVEESV